MEKTRKKKNKRDRSIAVIVTWDPAPSDLVTAISVLLILPVPREQAFGCHLPAVVPLVDTKQIFH